MSTFITLIDCREHPATALPFSGPEDLVAWLYANTPLMGWSHAEAVRSMILTRQLRLDTGYEQISASRFVDLFDKALFNLRAKRRKKNKPHNPAFRDGPVPLTGSGRRTWHVYRAPTHRMTLIEHGRTACPDDPDDVHPIRLKSPKVRTSWDDIARSDRKIRCWKKQRRTQWKDIS